MKNILRNRLALSTVVTTLIILVVSVLLAGVVTYFAINVTSTRVQEESLSLTSQHIWVASGGVAQGAIMITNTGGRDVVISKITVRGQTCDWSKVFNVATAKTDAGLTADLPYSATTPANAVAVNGFAASMATTSGSLVLPSGNTVVVYITSPDSIGLNDIGLTVAFTVFTSQAMYYKETNVNAAPAS
jgi:heme/copper-type cytochrome/quinol oxidase subunit 2